MKRYWILLFIALAVAALLMATRRSASVRRAPAASTPAPVVELKLELLPGARIDPAEAGVPKDHRVRLTVVNHAGRAVTFTLAAYEDRVAPSALAPDSTCRLEFLADRPGDDFAWMLDGAPAGRLRVTGSHLVEGHR